MGKVIGKTLDLRIVAAIKILALLVSSFAFAGADPLYPSCSDYLTQLGFKKILGPFNQVFTPEQMRAPYTGNGPSALDWVPPGLSENGRLVVVSGKGHIRIIDIDSGEEMDRISTHPEVRTYLLTFLGNDAVQHVDTEWNLNIYSLKDKRPLELLTRLWEIVHL